MCVVACISAKYVCLHSGIVFCTTKNYKEKSTLCRCDPCLSMPLFAPLWCRLRSYIDMAAKRGTTPLMMACAYGHVDCVRYLLAHGADPWRADGACCAALLLHPKAGRIFLFQFLLGWIVFGCLQFLFVQVR